MFAARYGVDRESDATGPPFGGSAGVMNNRYWQQAAIGTQQDTVDGALTASRFYLSEMSITPLRS